MSWWDSCSDGNQVHAVDAAAKIAEAHVEALLETGDGTLWIAAC